MFKIGSRSYAKQEVNLCDQMNGHEMFSPNVWVSYLKFSELIRLRIQAGLLRTDRSVHSLS